MRDLSYLLYIPILGEADEYGEPEELDSVSIDDFGDEYKNGFHTPERAKKEAIKFLNDYKAKKSSIMNHLEPNEHLYEVQIVESYYDGNDGQTEVIDSVTLDDIGENDKPVNSNSELKALLEKIYDELDKAQETSEAQDNEEVMYEIGEAMGAIDNAIDALEMED